MTASPPPATGLSDLAARYDVLFCDVWGVLHDGITVHPAADAALKKFREGGGTVILLTNAPFPHASVERLLAKRAVSREAWDAIVSSGDVTRAEITRRGASRVLHVGPERNLSLFRDLDIELVDIDTGQMLVCTGLYDDSTDEVADYADLFALSTGKKLPFVCANPDRTVDVGDKTYLCAGALADAYAALGGEVIWAGKPYSAIYERAQALAARLRGGPVHKSRILAIGDSLVTDMTGAANYGLDALFIGSGLHSKEVMALGGGLDMEKAASLLSGHPAKIVAMLPLLAW